MSDAKYIIGIDLGTTNSVVAYTETDLEKGKQPDIRVFEVPQLVDAGTLEKRNVAPSFILLPGPHDVPEGSLSLPWSREASLAVGEFARERGAELPHRLISSSKSWLCHKYVDRSKPILPWEGPEDMDKKSPVDAAALILSHIRDAWNHVMASEDPELRMENQEVLLTVPASFDAVARELTVKAAENAGLPRITLLEEPQAAFYAWIEASKDAWREKVEKGDLVLVCDVGGGTSDFSLISVDEEGGDLKLERIAVGDHLLVGGDNMDLALAYTASTQLSQKKKLNARQMRGLSHACRKGKEVILSDPDVSEYPVTILGSGSSLIGGTMKTMLGREMIENIIVDGFFPECGRTDAPAADRRAGIQELGLAYESDPGITRHLAAFLNRRTSDDGEGQNAMPTAILFNGGVMKAGPVRKRIIDLISSWSGGGNTVREIQTQDFDLSVARGAAYYGLARQGDGVRIRGGLNRSYYIGVAASLPAVPGMPIPIKSLCVAPFGMEEGTQEVLKDQEFVLVVGEPVKFDFLGSSIRLDDATGTVVEEWEEEIEEITTIETTLDGEMGSTIPIYLEIRATEIGTLEIWCVSREDSSRRWKLEFSVREQEREESVF